MNLRDLDFQVTAFAGVLTDFSRVAGSLSSFLLGTPLLFTKDFEKFARSLRRTITDPASTEE